MAQADQTIQNATFPTVRADINNNLAALFSDNSGATAPSPTVAFQDWIDTSGANPLWKKRNAANNAFITLGTIIGNTIAFEGTLPSQTGNAGKFLTTNGTVASFAAVAVGATVKAFTSSGTYTPTAGKTSFLVFCTGGGGGGGGAEGDFQSSGGGGGGGGGGGTGVRMYNSAEMGSTAAVTIGSAGAAGSNAPSNGGAGGASTIDPNGSGLTLTGAGGAGGARGFNGGVGLGGAGGASTNSQFPTNGQKGGTGLALVVSTNGSGTGGSSFWAGGTGAGGAGGTSPISDSRAGIAGTAGGIFIVEF